MDTEKIEKKVGRLNTDIMSGWEVGMKGKERLGRMLFDRVPPEHLTGQRREDWLAGRDAATGLLYSRKTYFAGKNAQGDFIVKRKGWVAPWPVVKALTAKGAIGDVLVTYFEDGEQIKDKTRICMTS